MNVGSKTAASSWLAIVTIGVSLLSFGLSEDPNNDLRDANVELTLLREGPNQTFLEACREFEKRREGQDSKEVWVKELLAGDQASSWLSSDFEVKGLLWCPYPSKNMTVREALDLVNDPNSSSLTLWPHSSFIKSLAAAIREKQKAHDTINSQENHDKFIKFYSLVADISDGERISKIRVTSDPAAGTHTLFQCGDIDVVFDPSDTEELPKYPVQLIILLENGYTYCFQEKDAPPTVERLYGTGGNKMVDFYKSYFRGRIEKTVNYSKKTSSKPTIWSLSKVQDIHNEQPPPLNGWLEFNLPTLRAQINDIGTMTVEDASIKINSKVESVQLNLELFGIKLPIQLFMISIVIVLPLLTTVVLSGYRLHGALALPETLQGLPNSLLTVALVCTVCLIPAMGLFLTGTKLQFAFPNIAPFFLIAAACWVIGSMMALAFIHRSRVRAS